MVDLLLLADAGSSAVAPGPEIFGAGLGVFLLLLGALKCAAIARRPETSGLCAGGLMLVLLGWAFATAPHIVKVLALAEKPGVQFGGNVLAVFGILMVLAGGILALVGLIDYGRHPEYRQGRVQGVVAALAAGFIVLVALGAFTAAFVKSVRQEAAAAGTEGTPIVLEDVNLTYTPPPRPWVKWDAKRLNKDVTFGLMRSRPQIFFMVIAEKGEDVDTAAIAEIAKGNLQSVATDVTLSAEAPRKIRDMEGLRFEADLTKDGHPLSYVFWICSRRGFHYQAIALAARNDRDALHREADDLFSRMAQIDPQREARAKPASPLGAYRSPELGLDLDLTGSGWREWTDLAKESPEAAVGGLREESGGFLVTPFLLEAEAPSPEAVVSAALKEWGITYPSPAILDLTKRREGDTLAIAFRTERKVDGVDYAYRMRFLLGKRYGVFVGVWSRPRFAGLDDWDADLSRRLRSTPPVPGLHADALPERRRLYHARFHNRVGLYHFTAKDYRTAASHFEVAVRLDPKERTYLTNVLDALGRDSRIKEALAYLARVESHQARQHDEVRSWEAWLLKEDGQPNRALAVYGALFAGAHHVDEDFEFYAALLAEAGRFDELTAAFDRYLAEAPSLKLRLEEARLLGKGKRHEQALDVLERLQKGMPVSAEVSFARLEQYRALGQHRQRVALCDELIRNGLASADVYYEKGDAEVKLKWYGRAKGTLEEALKLSPNDKDTQEYLRYVSGLLGEGDNSSVKEAIAAVALPVVLTERLRRPTPAGAGAADDFGASYVHWIEGYALGKDGELRTTVRQRIRVTDQAGVEQFSTLTIEFNPLAEAVFVNELLVRDAAGRVVGRGQTSDFYAIDRPQTDVASHDKTLFLPVPSLAAGHEIDLTFTRREPGRGGELPFLAIPLSAERPTQLRAVYVLAEPGRVRHRATAGLRTEPLPDGLLWRVEGPPAYPPEPSRVDPLRATQVVWIGPSGTKWPALVRDYLGKIESKLEASSEIEALSLRLTAGKTSRQQKIDSLVQHVRTGYVYKPIEFGRRARIPASATETVARKYGDCKDLSVLLHGLLRAAGIESRLALIHTRQDLQDDLPSLDQFNHMIVAVPEPGGGAPHFYDPTDKWLSVRVSPPVALAGAQALILDPARPRLERLGAYAPDSGTLQLERTVRIESDRTLVVEETLALGGYEASSLRAHLTTLDARRQKQWAQSVLGAVGRGAQLDRFEVLELRDAERALVVELTYRLPERCSAEAGVLRCTLPASWEAYYLGVSAVAERRTPFEIEYPLRLSSRTVVRGSTGCAGLALEGLPSGATSDFLKWASKPAPERGSATLGFDATLAPGTFEAARYGDYFRQSEQAIRSVSRSVTCSPTGQEARR